MKNQKGYALLTVLFIILLFSILGLSLLTINSSAAKQFSQKEIQVKSRHLAEMGILHYQSTVKQMVKKTEQNISNIKSNYDKKNPNSLSTLIAAENTKLCNDINNFSIAYGSKGKYKVESQSLGCPFDEDKVTLLVTSTGNAGSSSETESIINAELYVLGSVSPIVGGNGSNDNSTLPEKPDAPNDGTITTWPNNDSIIDEFVNTDVINLKKDTVIVNNHVLTNNLTISNGNKSALKVMGSLFINNNLESGTHSCIEVLGDFFTGDNIDLKNKGYLYIHGNANFPESIRLHKQHAEIYVAGDVYIKGVKQVPSEYNSIPNGSGCGFPAKAEPTVPIPTPWSLENDIKVNYIK